MVFGREKIIWEYLPVAFSPSLLSLITNLMSPCFLIFPTLFPPNPKISTKKNQANRKSLQKHFFPIMSFFFSTPFMFHKQPHHQSKNDLRKWKTKTGVYLMFMGEELHNAWLKLWAGKMPLKCRVLHPLPSTSFHGVCDNFNCRLFAHRLRNNIHVLSHFFTSCQAQKMFCRTQGNQFLATNHIFPIMKLFFTVSMRSRADAYISYTW